MTSVSTERTKAARCLLKNVCKKKKLEANLFLPFRPTIIFLNAKSNIDVEIFSHEKHVHKITCRWKGLIMDFSSGSSLALKYTMHF